MFISRLQVAMCMHRVELCSSFFFIVVAAACVNTHSYSNSFRNRYQFEPFLFVFASLLFCSFFAIFQALPHFANIRSRPNCVFVCLVMVTVAVVSDSWWTKFETILSHWDAADAGYCWLRQKCGGTAVMVTMIESRQRNTSHFIRWNWETFRLHLGCLSCNNAFRTDSKRVRDFRNRNM